MSRLAGFGLGLALGVGELLIALVIFVGGLWLNAQVYDAAPSLIYLSYNLVWLAAVVTFGLFGLFYLLVAVAGLTSADES